MITNPANPVNHRKLLNRKPVQHRNSVNTWNPVKLGKPEKLRNQATLIRPVKPRIPIFCLRFTIWFSLVSIYFPFHPPLGSHNQVLSTQRKVDSSSSSSSSQRSSPAPDIQSAQVVWRRPQNPQSLEVGKIQILGSESSESVFKTWCRVVHQMWGYVL